MKSFALTASGLQAYSSSVQIDVHMECTPMGDVNVTDLRQNLPSYLERARRGERIRVTSRGEVIAEISGPKVAEDEAELIRKQLRGAVMRYESPTEPAHAGEDWAVNQNR
jgi:antitoxin (DNA-binding transcriptional repressor) of toxin-antitoxin stability system